MNGILIDDEEHGLDELNYCIKNNTNINIIGMYQNPGIGLRQIIKNKPDIVFLDIEMSEMNGIKLAKKVLENNNDIKIIFVTAYNKYALEAFKVSALHYILKPFSENDLTEVLNRVSKTVPNEVLKKLNSTDFIKKIVLWESDCAFVVDVSDVIQIQIDSKKNGGKAIVFTDNGTYKTSNTLNYWESKLKKYNEFFRCHRNHIVNLNKIKQIEQWENSKYFIKLAEKEIYKTKEYKFSAFVGRYYIKQFRKLLGM